MTPRFWLCRGKRTRPRGSLVEHNRGEVEPRHVAQPAGWRGLIAGNVQRKSGNRWIALDFDQQRIGRISQRNEVR